jgi:ribosomal protein S18 acetylase RimI-like enzyme
VAGLDRGVRQSLGQIHVARDYWSWYSRLPSFYPELSLVAAAGSDLAEIVGFCHCRIDGRPGAPSGQQNGHLRWVGVRPAWQRRGLGEALTRAGMIALREARAERVYLGVDNNSYTGADRLYLRNGFTIYQRNLFYRHATSLEELSTGSRA